VERDNPKKIRIGRTNFAAVAMEIKKRGDFKKKFLSLCCIVTNTEWNGIIKLIIEVKCIRIME
jgi:hypothetical protein